MKPRANINRYLDDINDHPILSREETTELFKVLESGDGSARNKLVEANLKLVVSIAKNYVKPGIELDDLIAEGNIGLMHAISKYDWHLGFALSTYANWWIKQAILRYISNKNKLVKVPVHIANVKKKQARAIEDARAGGDVLSDNELAQKIGVTPKHLRDANFHLSDIVVSLSSSNNANDLALGDRLIDDGAVSQDERCSMNELSGVIKQIFCELPAREEAILRLRFGITGGPSSLRKMRSPKSPVQTKRSNDRWTTSCQRLEEFRTSAIDS